MRTLRSRNPFRRNLVRSCAASWVVALVFAASLCAQKTGLAFWAPPTAADTMLARSPRHDPDRYAALRQAFTEFHCTADLLKEQPVGTRGDKNLICTLPGQTPGVILVAARYDGHAGAGFQPTWVDAFFLPLLDHALQAQPRRHTFLFAALDGEDGETTFFTALRNSGKPLPSAMFVLDGLGWGSPLWYTVPLTKATPAHPIDFGVNGLLGGIASAVCRFMKIPDPQNLSPDHFLTNGGFSAAELYRSQRYNSSLFRGAGSIPELLLYSDQLERATQQEVVDLEVPDIRRDFDYTAYVLCLADLKLDPAPSPSPAAPAAPASAPSTSAPQ